MTENVTMKIGCWFDSHFAFCSQLTLPITPLQEVKDLEGKNVLPKGSLEERCPQRVGEKSEGHLRSREQESPGIGLQTKRVDT